jgi:hypothetical protein
LALGLAGLDVAAEEVQRPAVVAHLGGAVVALDGGEQGGVDAAARERGAAGGHGRPGGDALARAGAAAGALAVLGEGVQGAATGVGEDGPEVGVGDLDDGGVGLGRCGRVGLLGLLGVLGLGRLVLAAWVGVAAAGGQGDGEQGGQCRAASEVARPAHW